MSLAGKRVLVTGGTGFLGGALVKRLAEENAVVRVAARDPARGKYIAGLAGVEIVQGDITDVEQMQRAADGCEMVFHVAAYTGGKLDIQRQMNTIGTRNTAWAAATAGVERFIHVSTVAVYGYRQNGAVTENTPPAPGHDPYNITKAEAEAAVREIAAQNQMAYSIIRPAMIYGPRSGMWTGLLFRAAKRRPTLFLGNGSGSAYPIYVDDVVDMMVTMATHAKATGEIFNCAPDPSPTWREFLGAYSRLAGHERWLGLPAGAVYPAAAAASALARPNTQIKELANIIRLTQRQVTFKMTKARELLGWQPQVSLQEGVERCAGWLREKGWLP